MAERKTIGLRDIKALQPGQTIWDDKVAGFGARRQKGPAVAYVLLYRTEGGRQRWHTIGRHGAPWTPDLARAEAKRLLGAVVKGDDPAGEKQATRKATTVAELCDAYLADAESGRLLTRRRVAKKASTLATDRGRVERHIKPLLGALKVAAVTRDDIDAFLHDVAAGKTAMRAKSGKPRGVAHVRGGRGTASRTTGLLGAIFAYAVRHRMRADNPVHGVTRFADGKRERRLSDAEYAALGSALRAGVETIRPAALAAAHFLALTGWRRGEALGLRWAEVDLDRRTATLTDTKTGRSVRPLSHAACDLLRAMPREDALAFPAAKGDGEMSGFARFWGRIARLGALPGDLTPHVMRHSFASLAGDLGFSESTIAALVGHKGQTITSRYVHAADAVLLAAADAVAARTNELMGFATPSGVIVPLKRSGAASA
jgi:integrase